MIVSRQVRLDGENNRIKRSRNLMCSGRVSSFSAMSLLYVIRLQFVNEPISFPKSAELTLVVICGCLMTNIPVSAF